MEHWFNLVQFTKREGLGVQKTTSAVWCGSWPSGWNELLDAWQRHSHWLLSHFLGHLCPSDPWTSMVETWNTCHSRTLDVPLMFIEWNITGFNPIAGRLCGHSAVFPGVSTVVWSGFSSHLWWIFWHFFKVSSKSLPLSLLYTFLSFLSFLSSTFAHFFTSRNVARNVVLLRFTAPPEAQAFATRPWGPWGPWRPWRPCRGAESRRENCDCRAMRRKTCCGRRTVYSYHWYHWYLLIL